MVCRLNPVSPSRKASGISSSRCLIRSSAIPLFTPYRTSEGILSNIANSKRPPAVISDATGGKWMCFRINEKS
jgi:hypothetical protein